MSITDTHIEIRLVQFSLYYWNAMCKPTTHHVLEPQFSAENQRAPQTRHQFPTFYVLYLAL